MKKMITIATVFLVGCSGENTIYIKHYNDDHGNDIEILDNNGAMIASKNVKSCGLIMSANRAHDATTEFDIDDEHERVTVRTTHRGRYDIEVVDGAEY